jgi:hypothetical protein
MFNGHSVLHLDATPASLQPSRAHAKQDLSKFFLGMCSSGLNLTGASQNDLSMPLNTGH